MAIRVRLRASLGMWKLGVLFSCGVGGVCSRLHSPRRKPAGDGGVRSNRHRRLRPGDELRDLANAADGLRRDLLHHRRRLRVLALHRADSIPERADPIEPARLSPFWIIMMVMALYIVLGTFLDEVSTILITVPVTLPLINSIGYDGIWFAGLAPVMCTIGLISPPTGMTVFMIQRRRLQFR